MVDNAKESWVKIGQALQDIFVFWYHFFIDLFASIGDLISSSGNVSTTGIKYSADFSNSVLQDIGNLFKGQPSGQPTTNTAPNTTPTNNTTNTATNTNIDNAIQNAPSTSATQSSPEPVASANTTTQSPQQWCFIGMDENSTNVCVPLKNNQTCSSNRVYDSRNSCMNNVTSSS